MYELDRNQSVLAEKAVLVGVILPRHEHITDPLEELEGLVETAGARVVDRLTQRRDTPQNSTYLGSTTLSRWNFQTHFHFG